MFNIYNDMDNKKSKGYAIYFSAIAFILSITAFFLLASIFRYYRSEVSIIYIPKNEKMAAISEQVINNLAVILKKQDKEISARREGKSSIISISAIEKNYADSEIASRTAAFNLFSTMSRYYDIKNEIDLRIIDGPITSPVTKNWPWIILASILMGSAASVIINFISQIISGASEYVSEKRREMTTRLQEKALEKKIELKPEKKPEEPKAPETVRAIQEKKSAAPDNLPILEEAQPILEEIAPEDINILNEMEEKAESEMHREPTQEELKKRLNKLLKGEL